ncbi:MAG: glycosyl hydrolase-related protein, partial [Anaerolineae bacterium]
LEWQPAKHWEVHMRQFSHHDPGYTDLPSHVIAEFDGFMDDVLAYCRMTEDWPWESRFRYLAEQSWSVVNYVRHRPQEVVDELAHFVRNGQIELTGLFANMTSELCGHEQMIRLLYPSARLKRQWGVDVLSATNNDIPGFSWGYAGVLPGAGVRYFTPGIPRWYFGVGEKAVHPLWDEERVLKMAVPGAFWWLAPDGQRVLLWYDWHGGEWHPSSYGEAMRQLPTMLRQADAEGYPHEIIGYMLRGGLRDNAPLSDRYAYLVRQWNATWAYPRLINSTNIIFLSEFERRYGDSLRTLRGEAPGTDYSVGAAGTAKETAVNRGAHDLLLTAERLATIAWLQGGYEFPAETIEDGYESSFYYDEHAWGMHGAGGPAHDASFFEKGGRAYRAAALAHDVALKAANRLADGIAYLHDGYYITVFNPLAWARSDTVRLAAADWPPCGMPMHWRPAQQEGDGPMLVAGTALGRSITFPPQSLLASPFDLVEVETGRRVPFQLSTPTDPQAPEPWAAERVAMAKVDGRFGQVLSFQANDLPPLGYRTYEVVPRPAWRRQPARGRATAGTIENDHFALRLDRAGGRIASLYDKDLGRELLDEAAPHPFGRPLVRDSATGAIDLGRVTDVQTGERGPLFTTLVLKGEATGCPRWTQELRLHHASKRLDVSTRLLRDSTPTLEVYFGFPFAVAAPRFRFESANSVMEPTVDQLPGSNTDYYAMQHWADVSSGTDDWGLTWTSLDAPMAEFGGLWPGYVSAAHHGVTGPGWGHPFLEPGQIDKGHIYSLAIYNNFRTNFYNVRDGEALFRYSLTTHRGGWSAGAAAFGWGAAMPPLAVWMKGPQAGHLAPSCSFLQLEGADGVVLLALKPAEDGRGLIVRLIETQGREAHVSVRLPWLAIIQAYSTNLIEEDQQPLPAGRQEVRLPLAPFGFATVRLIVDRP